MSIKSISIAALGLAVVTLSARALPRTTASGAPMYAVIVNVQNRSNFGAVTINFYAICGQAN